MKCPHCKLESPPDASRCDCGWDFATNQKAESLLPASAAVPSAHPLSRRGRTLALGGLVCMFILGATRQLLGSSPFGLFIGVLSDISVLVLFAGLATWAVGALRSRRASTSA